MAKQYTIKTPPAILAQDVRLTDFTSVGTISITGVITKQKIYNALLPFGVINGVDLAHLNVNNTGHIIYILQRFDIVSGPQKYKTPVGWRLPSPILKCLLTLEGVAGLSSSLDWGYSLGGNPSHEQ